MKDGRSPESPIPEDGIAAPRPPAVVEDVALPCTRFRLDNGLTVIVHEDRRTPVIALSVTYLVGSKDEAPGRTGLAHLCEHLMFSGSRHLPGSYIVNLSSAGADDLNGNTTPDRSHYHQTVPTAALDYALFAESDRMGHLLAAITQQTLDQQREVVMNEKCQREGAVHGSTLQRTLRALYPPQHPYAHTALGSMQDLAKLSLDDVRDWFATWYVPSNAILVLAGDLDVATAREKVQHWFGAIPPGHVPDRGLPTAWVPSLPEAWHETLHDQVPLARLNVVWNVPGYDREDAVLLGMVAILLAGGRTARLSRRLLHGSVQLASGVSAGMQHGQLAGRFEICVDVLGDGNDFGRIQTEIAAAIDELRTQGPAEAELQRIKLQERAGFLRGTVGMASIAALLSDHQRLCGSPDGYRPRMRIVAAADTATIRAAVARWLTRPALHLQVLPRVALNASPAAPERSLAPVVGRPRPAPLPMLERATLANGLNVILARRHDRPLLRMALHFRVGQGDEPAGRDGLARLATGLLLGGAGARDGDAFVDASQAIAATITARSSLDWTVLEMDALSVQLRPSLQLFFDASVRPRFDPVDVERARVLQLHALQRELAQPEALLLRRLPAMLYGRGHRHARAFSGLGKHESLAGIAHADVLDFHARWFRPEGATLVVAGDTTLEVLVRELERCCASWHGAAAHQSRPEWVDMAAPPAACLVGHRPDSPQSRVIAATLVPAFDPRHEAAIEIGNAILGGGFSSRINMNLREDKHWSYGAGSGLSADARGQRIFDVSASVQADRTADAMAQILLELQQAASVRPITREELQLHQHAAAARMAGMGQTLSGVCHTVGRLLHDALPDDYPMQHAERIAGLTLAAVNAGVRELARPEHLHWLVVGDCEVVVPQLRAAGWKTQLLTPDRD